MYRNILVESTNFDVLYFWAGIMGYYILKQMIAQMTQTQVPAHATSIFLAHLKLFCIVMLLFCTLEHFHLGQK